MTLKHGWNIKQNNKAPLCGGGNWKPSQALLTCINLLVKSGHCFTYQKSGLGCSQKKGTPCLQLPKVWIGRLTSQTNSPYQDVRQWPVLLTVAYCWCLQHWAEKHNLPGNPDFCLLAESVRELRQTICEFVNITWEDMMKGLKMEEPEGGHWPSTMTQLCVS